MSVLNIKLNSCLLFVRRTDDHVTQPNDILALKTPLCSSLGNVVYIKTHKTSSTTVQSIFHRYGLKRNLSFVFRRANKRNGHIRYIKITKASPKTMFLPVLGTGNCSYKGYNISAVHVVHNRPVMDSYMNPGTKYVTILRNPASQLISAFLFFHLDKNVFGTSVEEKLIRYMKGRKWMKSSYGRNSQSYDLGLSRSKFKNKTEINLLIERLSKELDLVMIAEYFEESLVLLKRELCWYFEDIVYTVKNNRSRSKPPLSRNLLKEIKTFNKADFMLYEHFNETFWNKIAQVGPVFWKELAEFKRLQHETMFRCVNVATSSTGSVHGNHSDDLCKHLKEHTFTALFHRQTRNC
ncbi:Galactose-3-O-sulfotransferase 3 [Holothuria leucospilota]|uniref:Galactose-3-O-sulfotransferase 3 n=1 Tax=Holothuria leucospilota TaxID=206669 RepID=A0A9Q1C3T4_HOLLE|nr:Galactose-3-O-sulfotransferase 3 [Holothuria leucospilota]